MIYKEVNYEVFMEIVDNVKYQNQDIIEAKEFGYKSIKEAYMKAEHAWCRYWVVSHEDTVLTTILEARDGNLTYFTTTELPGNDMFMYRKVLGKLVKKVTKCREVVFVRVAMWYKPAQTLLRIVGFRRHIIANHNSIWVYEYGKQN